MIRFCFISVCDQKTPVEWEEEADESYAWSFEVDVEAEAARSEAGVVKSESTDGIDAWISEPESETVESEQGPDGLESGTVESGAEAVKSDVGVES